ncbi:MAG: hypothetical protein JWP44_3767 [Mucilaginibacter sp.]|nr:hypothetical protein [Mucilaginibacter sp.]
MAKQVHRLLRGYTLDPGFSTRLDTMGINETTYRIRWEDLSVPMTEVSAATVLNNHVGPSGEYFEVIDVDPPSNCFYEPVNLDDISVLAQNGLTPSEGNPQFHQQFVYTIAMKTLDLFEQALGRRLIWNARFVKKGEPDEYVGQIRIYPHARRDANAYYDTRKKAILFGYFKAALQVQGTNFPGGTIFSCLSPDIIAHEVTHALVDSIHPRFLENTNRDVPAFHEGFSDIVALLQRFTINDLVISQIALSGGDLNHFNYLGELATQFGTALANGRGALRSGIGEYVGDKWVRRKADPALYQTTTEPHERGSILVATFFDALIKVYSYKTADLIRIASGGTGILPQGSISPDLAKRLAQEVCEIAGHLLSIAIRALDYCPPVDITFGDFLRALITADIEFAQPGENNYRIALIDAFRSWGIFPDQVNTLSEESLQWSTPDLNPVQARALQVTADFLKPLVRELTSISDRKALWERSQQIQRQLHVFLMDTKRPNFSEDEWEQWLRKLGLTTDELIFDDEKGNPLNKVEAVPIEIHKVRPAYRVGNQGLILEQVIVSITQSVNIKVNSGGAEPQEIRFRGGSTIIFDSSKDFSLSYIITKNIRSQERFQAQADYQQGDSTQDYSFTDSMYEENTALSPINFAHLHFH